MSGVNAYLGPVQVPSRVKIATNRRSFQFGKSTESTDVNPTSVSGVIQNESLLMLLVWVGVGQNPAPVRRIGTVTTRSENTCADTLHFSRAVSEQKTPVTHYAVPSPPWNLWPAVVESHDVPQERVAEKTTPPH